MIAIVCFDENNGMFFNERRQSKDRYVIRDIVHMVENNTLYINEYSKELFKNTPANIRFLKIILIRCQTMSIVLLKIKLLIF